MVEFRFTELNFKSLIQQQNILSLRLKEFYYDAMLEGNWFLKKYFFCIMGVWDDGKCW